jgi:hypothetical protein
MKNDLIKGAMERRHLVWLLVLNLCSAEFVLLELLDHPKTKGREKQQINQRRRFVQNWLAQATRRQDREEIETQTTEHIAFMAEAQMLLGLCDPSQLEWISEELAKLVMAANNRATLEKTQKNTENAQA